eukprot:1161734-Pelagomonas_calceolata.AAC.23
MLVAPALLVLLWPCILVLCELLVVCVYPRILSTKGAPSPLQSQGARLKYACRMLVALALFALSRVLSSHCVSWLCVCVNTLTWQHGPVLIWHASCPHMAAQTCPHMACLWSCVCAPMQPRRQGRPRPAAAAAAGGWAWESPEPTPTSEAAAKVGPGRIRVTQNKERVLVGVRQGEACCPALDVAWVWTRERHAAMLEP